ATAPVVPAPPRAAPEQTACGGPHPASERANAGPSTRGIGCLSPTGPRLGPTGTTLIMPADPKSLLPILPPHPVPAAPTPAPRPAAEGEEGTDASGGLSPAKLLHALRRRGLVAVPLALAAGV